MLGEPSSSELQSRKGDNYCSDTLKKSPFVFFSILLHYWPQKLLQRGQLELSQECPGAKTLKEINLQPYQWSCGHQEGEVILCFFFLLFTLSFLIFVLVMSIFANGHRRKEQLKPLLYGHGTQKGSSEDTETSTDCKKEGCRESSSLE